MRAELRRADEGHEIRSAIETWRTGNAIDEATASALHELWPDDRRRARPAFRALFFVLTLFAGLALWGFGVVVFDFGFGGGFDSLPHAGWLALVAALAGGGAAHAIGTLRLRGFGVEEGLCALALGFETAALALVLDQGDPSTAATFALLGVNGAVVGLAIGWFWGIPGSGLAAACGLFAALASLPAPRLAWLAAALAILPFARRARRIEGVAPAHRGRAAEVFGAATLALYFAIHPSNVLRGFFDEVGDRRLGDAGAFGGVEPVTAAGWFVIVVLPLLLVASGIARSDRFELDLGALLALATGISVGDALDLAPLWAALLGAGLLLGALVLTLRQRFSSRPDRIRAGFTDRALFGAESGESWFELAAAMAALTPAPRRSPGPGPEPPGFEGGDGKFGGGGASSGF